MSTRNSLASVIKSLKLAISSEWLELSRSEVAEQYNCSSNTAAAALMSLQMDDKIEFKIVDSNKTIVKAYRTGTCISKWHTLTADNDLFVNLNKNQISQIINKIKLYNKPANCEVLFKVLTICEAMLCMRNVDNGIASKTIENHALLRYYLKDLDFMRKNNILNLHNDKYRVCVSSGKSVSAEAYILQQKQLEENESTFKIPTKEEVLNNKPSEEVKESILPEVVDAKQQPEIVPNAETKSVIDKSFVEDMIMEICTKIETDNQTTLKRYKNNADRLEASITKYEETLAKATKLISQLNVVMDNNSKLLLATKEENTKLKEELSNLQKEYSALKKKHVKQENVINTMLRGFGIELPKEI